MDAKSLVVTVHGRSEVTWEADIAGVTEVESGAFSFEGWLFALIVEKSSKAPERWSVYLSECLRPSASVGKEWKLKEAVRAEEVTTKLKVQVVMTKLEAKLKYRG